MGRIEPVTDDDLPGSVGSPLLEMVSICDSIVIMASPAGPFRTIRDSILRGEVFSVESFERDLLMGWSLGKDRNWMKQGEGENQYEN